MSQIALIAEFSLNCAESDADGFPLFAEVNGQLSPVVRIADNRFQVSDDPIRIEIALNGVDDSVNGITMNNFSNRLAGPRIHHPVAVNALFVCSTRKASVLCERPNDRAAM